MTDVPNGRREPDAGSSASLSCLCTRASSVIGGKTYSIADIAIFPWVSSWQKQGIDWADYPALKTWFDKIAARPAVQRGCKVLADLRK